MRWLVLLLSSLASGQIVTSGLVAQYAMTDASGTTLPDSSGNSNNGTLVGTPTIGSLGIAFNGTSQYASLPSGLSTTIKTIQILTDCDRYLNSTTKAQILGSSSPTGLRISCGNSTNGTTSTGLNKLVELDMSTTLNGSITSGATSLTVVSPERMPAGNYVFIDSETILCSTLTGNTYSGCSRGQVGTTAASHSNGAGVFGGAIGNGSNSALISYFNMISPSMYTAVLDATNSRVLDNGGETLYGGFYSTSSSPFTIANNTGAWQLGGDAGEFFTGTIYYVLLYTSELTNLQIQQNVTAVQAIMSARGVPVRTDGSHTGSIWDCEGTSIDNYGSPGWCAGTVVTGSPQVLINSQPGVTYGSGVGSGILSYTVARDGPLTNPMAARNIITLGAPTNDFVTSTLTQVEGYYTSTIASVRAQGWSQVYCGLMLSRTGTAAGFGGTYDAAHDAWNTWLLANYASIGCTNIISWDTRFTADGAYANPNPTACGGTTCFSGDGVHPDQTGFAAMSLLAAPIINGGTPVPVTVVGSTQTQVVVQYTAPSIAACTVSGTDQNGGPAIADLNATLFPGANQDLSRTVANGFRWPTLVNGLTRTVVIGTHDQIKKGSDGNSYSTALQVASAQFISIACNSGANTGSVTAITANLPYGSYYPELPIPDPTQVTFGVQPTIAWNDTTRQYIDPITGVLMQRISSPIDSLVGGFTMVFATPVIDVTGSAWTNPANFITDQVSGTLATTSTQNAAIFAPFDPSFVPYCCGLSWTDFQIAPYGNASSGAVQESISISTDSGQTSLVTTPITTTFATGVQAYTAIPSSYPSNNFSAWGGVLGWFGAEDLQNRTFTGVSCSGTPTVCTIIAPSNVVGFNLSRKAGTSFYISSCASGTAARLTIATTDSWQQITTQQTSGSTWTNCTYRDLAVGIRAVMSTTGTLNVSISGAATVGVSGSSGSNGARWIGGLSPVTDIATDCNGGTQSPPLSGYLVGLSGNSAVYVIQSNGVTCLQSNLYVNHGAQSGHAAALSGTVIPFLNNNTMILGDAANNPPHIWKAVHQANNYTAVVPANPSSNTVDNFAWTDLGTAAAVIGTQISAAGGAIATAYNSGLFNLTLDTIGDNGAGGTIIQFRMQATSGGIGGTGINDGACAIVFADGNFNYIGSLPIFGGYPTSWGACHFGGDVAANYSIWDSQAESSQLSPIFWSNVVPLGGPFVARSSAGLYKNGSLTTWPISISSCTNASPAICTSTANNLDQVATLVNASAGAWVQISGGTGNWAAINGGMYAHYISGNTFSLYSDPVGLTTPTGVTATPCTGGCGGTAGSISINYEIAAINPSGKHSPVSSAGTTTTANATLSSTNYVIVAWSCVAGATYNVYRTAAGGSPATTGFIGTTSNCSFNDTGLAGDSSTPPTTNTSAIDATSFGTFTGTVVGNMLPPLYSVQIASVVNNGGNARMVSTLAGGYSRYFPSATLVMQDADPITITPTYFNSTTQYYAKVSGAPAGDFDVYNDAALSSPVAYSALSGVAGQFASFAQTCPDPVTLSLPGPMYMDTGIGTTGAGNQKVRCVKIRLHDAGCSDFPATGEHASYPCSSDPTNTSRSSLHAWNVGDAIGDVSHFANNHEILFVLAVNVVSQNTIDVTLERSYGDDPSYVWRGFFGCLSCDYYNAQHSPGWTPWAEASIPAGLVSTTTSPTFAIPPVNGSHNDFVAGATAGNVSQVSGYQGTATGAAVPDSKINATIGTFTGPMTELHASFPYWSVGFSQSTLYSFASAVGQSYPSMRMISGQAPVSEMNSTFSWNSDWAAMNGGFGNSQNNGDGVEVRSLTNIRGGTYDSGSATTIVYLIQTLQPGAVNIKIAPMFVNGFPSYAMSDMSGPSSLIADANQGLYCVVYVAGECRPNSIVGQVFEAIRNYSDSQGYCISNNSTLNFPCAFGLWPGGGWAAQIRNVPLDILNQGFRRLTLGWTLPINHYSFINWISTPDAKWGLFAGNPIQQHPLRTGYTGTQWFMMKLPPSPPRSTATPGAFFPVGVSVGACATGDELRVAFGYAENGNPAFLWGTTREEETFTTTAATASNPFAFATSDSQGYMACSPNAQISVPAIPGRIVFIVVDRFNTVSGLHSYGPLTMVPVP